MSETTDGDGAERSGWLERVVRPLPYLTLIGSTVLVLLAGETALPLPVTFVVVALTAGWMLWFVTLHPEWVQRRALMATFFLGLLVLIAVLILCSPLYGFFAWTGYLFVVTTLHRRWTLGGAAAVAVLTAVSQTHGYPALLDGEKVVTFAIVLAFNVSIATAMTFLAMASDRQAARRQRLITTLGESNVRLEKALRENKGLHAQLLTQAREAGVLDERQRLAGEIHDVIAQGLTGIVTQLEAAEQAGDRSQHMYAARQLARDSLSEVRRSVQALCPQQLDTAELPEALTAVAGRWSSLHEVATDVMTTGTPRPLSAAVELTLLRTAQEALANVARHAEASRVAVTLSYMDDLVSLDIRDDGTGFDPGRPRVARHDGGFGLAAMRERVQRIAGTLAVESEPGGGTAISALVPVAPALVNG
ncbi:sensor histidine kinase [Jidongwangia harbinensis]|uniref:sensor histidine kinase n=1 Tax=Jidongwangia harbinensis TaxID=2878561 RepID=UPI001CD9CAF3|nr:sensor histidine kinase [Jidongwangia harbinensis]MCA2219061.1 sensor histidine kinase [Jidongwangia harbinensis]